MGSQSSHSKLYLRHSLQLAWVFQYHPEGTLMHHRKENIRVRIILATRQTQSLWEHVTEPHLSVHWAATQWSRRATPAADVSMTQSKILAGELVLEPTVSYQLLRTSLRSTMMYRVVSPIPSVSIVSIGSSTRAIAPTQLRPLHRCPRP